MTITEHKALVAANIEDPVIGETIEVSSDGERWYSGKFTVLTINASYWIDTPGYDRSSWPYARRPAAAAPKLKRLFKVIDTETGSEVTENELAKSICFSPVTGCRVAAILADYSGEVCLEDSCGTTRGLPMKYRAVPDDWQNSLERRPT